MDCSISAPSVAYSRRKHRSHSNAWVSVSIRPHLVGDVTPQLLVRLSDHVAFVVRLNPERHQQQQKHRRLFSLVFLPRTAPPSFNSMCAALNLRLI